MSLHVSIPMIPVTTTFKIELEDDVTAMLIEIADASHCDPRQIAAALLSDVLRDDALMHQPHGGPDISALN